MCSVFRKSACPFGQVKTEMYLLESPFSKDSLARASRLVLMLVPALVDPSDGTMITVVESRQQVNSNQLIGWRLYT